ncbi:MAG: hypothetical protein M5U34_33375 [Chloroflexi bacterium]|nr:hypothetical protein [Chloroflexota bacterium]
MPAAILLFPLTAVLTLPTAAILLLTQSRSGWLGAGRGLGVAGAVEPHPAYLPQTELLWAGIGLMLLAGIAGLLWLGPENSPSCGMIRHKWDKRPWAASTPSASARKYGVGV